MTQLGPEEDLGVFNDREKVWKLSPFNKIAKRYSREILIIKGLNQYKR